MLPIKESSSSISDGRMRHEALQHEAFLSTILRAVLNHEPDLNNTLREDENANITNETRQVSFMD